MKVADIFRPRGGMSQTAVFTLSESHSFIVILGPAKHREGLTGDPVDKVGGVLVLDVEHLLVHLLHRHPPAEDGRCGQVSPVPRVARRHHVLRVEDLKIVQRSGFIRIAWLG